MFFGSDNMSGVSPRIMDAIVEANSGYAPAYGGDELTARVEDMLAELFEHEVCVSLVSTGTAANALALSCMVEPYGAVVCHSESHISVDECGAPEFFSGGAKLVHGPGYGAKLDVGTLSGILGRVGGRTPHHVKPQALTLTQATEAGMVYTIEEVRALSRLAHDRGLKVHMDGARFANAVCSLECTPADMTWKAGVDMLSFGATKAGAMAAEAVIAFDPALREELSYRRKRGGHLVSKHRFLAAQWLGFLREGHWRELAGHANAMAARLAGAIEASNSARLAFPVQGNELLVVMDKSTARHLREKGAVFYDWPDHDIGVEPPLGEGETLGRIVTSFATTKEDIDAFAALLGGC